MTPTPAYSTDQVRSEIVAIISDMVQDWDVQVRGGVGRSTRLVGDLGFSSVDIISLVVSIEEHFGTRNLGFADLLMRDGRYVDDLGVDEIAGFVASRLERSSP